MKDNREVRDKLARAMGWAYSSDYGHVLEEGSTAKLPRIFLDAWNSDQHPIPNTLDSAAACLREGWIWRREFATDPHHPELGLMLIWSTHHDKHGMVWLRDTGDELADRFALALASWEASAVKGTR